MNNPFLWLWLAIGWLAYRVLRSPLAMGAPGTSLLGQQPDQGANVYIGQVGNNLTVEEITQLVPQRAVMAYFISRYAQPASPVGRASMPSVVAEVHADWTEGKDVIIDVSNYRILDEGGVLKVDGWAVWTWQLPGKPIFYGWRAKLHPVDYKLAQDLKMVGLN